MYPAFLERLGYNAAAKVCEMKRLGAELADRAKAIDRASSTLPTPNPRRRRATDEDVAADGQE